MPTTSDGGRTWLRRTQTATAVALLLLAASCGPRTPSALSSGSPVVRATPSASPISIPPFTETFTSPTMGYSVKYPAGWKVTVASQSWPLGNTSYWDTPDGDRMESDSAGFRGTSQALAAGQSEAQWITQYIASSMPCGNREQVPVGAFVGTIDLNDCTGMGRLGGRVFDIALVVGGRGYNFTMEGQVDRNFFLAMLATVTFTPQTAKP